MLRNYKYAYNLFDNQKILKKIRTKLNSEQGEILDDSGMLFLANKKHKNRIINNSQKLTPLNQHTHKYICNLFLAKNLAEAQAKRRTYELGFDYSKGIKFLRINKKDRVLYEAEQLVVAEPREKKASRLEVGYFKYTLEHIPNTDTLKLHSDMGYSSRLISK
jgi:hypothetical protein